MSIIRDKSKAPLTLVQDIGLLIIALCTIMAMGIEMHSMYARLEVTLADLLLLFIYLEVLAMVAMYLESGKLPVRMPLYIAIVALARYLILDMKNLDTMRMLAISGVIAIIALAIFIIRYGHSRYPYNKSDDSLIESQLKHYKK
ncbi:phosphate-starvation-inducible PsiE family protein [Thalassotalea psychrophila]|uniref:Protein PsiE n=1 Tax=Thalassotalea psychrophila TaxID=3065647 RepID=A0ABY9TW62_9GAMM|nr:phosphate-starvation-inducible PsiE family protein [Colwelliaceae bacterium SQ149]